MSLFPKKPNFFQYFDNLTKIIDQVGKIVVNVKPYSSSNIVKKIRQLELKADKTCHQLYTLANTTFLPPFDREDIYLLARSLDNLVDLAEDLVFGIINYKLKKEEKEFKKFRELIGQTAKKLTTLISLLQHREKYIQKMRQIISEINTLENQGDDLIRKGLTILFNNNKDAVAIIKNKELLETAEAILDEAENCAFVVEEIIVKNF